MMFVLGFVCFFAIVLKVSVHNSIYIMDNLRLSDVSENPKYLHGKKIVEQFEQQFE